jgi:nucleotide-binding universal stress UspA family protein
MGFRDILVVLDGGPASEERLRLAARIAREQGACLSAAFLQADRPVKLRSTPQGQQNALTLGVSSILTGATASVEADGCETQAEVFERRFRDCLRSMDDEGEWHCIHRPDPAALLTLAKGADLVVIGQVNPHVGSNPSWYRPEEVVINCGRPVLMVPYIGTFGQAGRRVLIAWDGSREAVRAVNDALPILHPAKKVTLMTVRAQTRDFQPDRIPMQNMIRHLARHGIVAEADHTLRGDNKIHDVLLSLTVDIAADLMVAGAYHRSPLREALIGGVSRGLLHHMTVPVLMSH